jgi:hypothetical protein
VVNLFLHPNLRGQPIPAPEKTICRYVAEFGYAACPHTACGLFAVQEQLGPAGHDVITLSTAHPGKFENYGPAAKACKPELPPQLENLLERKTKVTHIAKSAAQVELFVSGVALKTSTAAAAAAAGTTSGGSSTGRTELPIEYLLGAWALGAVMAHVLFPLLK